MPIRVAGFEALDCEEDVPSGERRALPVALGNVLSNAALRSAFADCNAQQKYFSCHAISRLFWDSLGWSAEN